MYDDIQKLGAKAARDGLTLWDCPFYRAEAMPGHTGESITEWRLKIDAWECGFLRAVESRSPLPSCRPPPARRPHAV